MDSKLWPYGPIFCPEAEANECSILFFIVQLIFFFKIKRKLVFLMFVIHLNDTTLKTLLLQILVTKMIFSRKLGGVPFFPLSVGKIRAYMNRFYCPNSNFKGKHTCSDPNHLACFLIQFFCLRILWKIITFLKDIFKPNVLYHF